MRAFSGGWSTNQIRKGINFYQAITCLQMFQTTRQNYLPSAVSFYQAINYLPSAVSYYIKKYSFTQAKSLQSTFPTRCRFQANGGFFRRWHTVPRRRGHAGRSCWHGRSHTDFFLHIFLFLFLCPGLKALVATELSPAPGRWLAFHWCRSNNTGTICTSTLKEKKKNPI